MKCLQHKPAALCIAVFLLSLQPVVLANQLGVWQPVHNPCDPNLPSQLVASGVLVQKICKYGAECINTMKHEAFCKAPEGSETVALPGVPRGMARRNAPSELSYLSIGHQIHRVNIASGSPVVDYFAGSTEGHNDAALSSAQFATPIGIAFSSHGVYIADYGNHRIRHIGSGVVTTVAGSGTPGHNDANGVSAQFDKPYDLVLHNDRVWVVETGNHRIREIAPNGDVTTFAGSGTSGTTNANGVSAEFSLPSGITRDPTTGDLFVSDYGTALIRKITPNGDVTTLAGSGNAVSFADGIGVLADFQNPAGLDFHSDGYLVVCDYHNRRLRKVFIADGATTTLMGNGVAGNVDGIGTNAQLTNPNSVVISVDGAWMYIVDEGGSKLRRMYLKEFF